MIGFILQDLLIFSNFQNSNYHALILIRHFGSCPSFRLHMAHSHNHTRLQLASLLPLTHPRRIKTMMMIRKRRSVLTALLATSFCTALLSSSSSLAFSPSSTLTTRRGASDTADGRLHRHRHAASTSTESSTAAAAETARPLVDERTGKPTGLSFLSAETIARAEKGSPVEKVKLEKDGTAAFVDVYEYARKIREGEMTWEEVEKADLDSVRGLLASVMVWRCVGFSANVNQTMLLVVKILEDRLTMLS